MLHVPARFTISDDRGRNHPEGLILGRGKMIFGISAVAGTDFLP